MSETALHYLIITVGTAGDIHPFMRIASALQALGRKVTFITDTYHANLIKGVGLPFIGLGTDADYLRMVANPDLWDPKKGSAARMANYRDLLEQIDEAIRSVSAQAPRSRLPIHSQYRVQPSHGNAVSSSQSLPPTAPTVTRLPGLATSASICAATSRSAVPCEALACTLTTSPWRLSLSTCPR